MPSGKAFKVALIPALYAFAFWTIAGTATTARDDEYVGSEACKDCHEDQFKNFVPTSHAKLGRRATLYIGYRINKDTGQGSRISDPTSNPVRVVIKVPPGAFEI